MKKVFLLVTLFSLALAGESFGFTLRWVNPDRMAYHRHNHSYSHYSYNGYSEDDYSRRWGNGGKWERVDWAAVAHEIRPIVIKVIETINRRDDDNLTHERVRRVYEYRQPRYPYPPYQRGGEKK